MPDHDHFLLGGLVAESDQRLAIRLLRREWNWHLALQVPSCRLQIQSFDHVLRDDERRREPFQSTCNYILDNPVRAGLVQNYRHWPWLGGFVVGYPRLDPRDDDFWDDFWKIYANERDWEGTGP